MSAEENTDGVSVPICPKILRPQIPSNLQIINEEIGCVFVTIHAWERFCERWYPETKASRSIKIANCLQRSFARAKKVELKGHHAVQRMVNNNFEEADYFFDSRMNCRFVVSAKQGRKILLTVEVPR